MAQDSKKEERASQFAWRRISLISVTILAISLLATQVLVLDDDEGLLDHFTAAWSSLLQPSSWDEDYPDPEPLPRDMPGDLENDKSIQLNSTLGFSKIFVLHANPLDNRRDELAMMSAVSDVTVTYSEVPLWNAKTNVSLAGLPWHDAELTNEEWVT